MASGRVEGEGGGEGGGNEVPPEKQRLVATRVYTRKFFRGRGNNVGGAAAAVTPSSADVPLAERTTPAVICSPSDVENRVLCESGDADIGTSGGVVRETEAAAVPVDEPRIDSVSGSDAEKGIRSNNGDVVIEETVEEPFVDASKGTVSESKAPQPTESVVAEPQAVVSEKDAEAGPGGGSAEDMIVEPVAPPLNSTPQKRHTVIIKKATIGQQQSASLPDAPPDSSVNRNRQVEMDSAADNGQQNGGLDGRVRLNVSSRTRHEKIELRRKLESELAVIRGFVERIEAKQGQLGFGVFTGLRVSVNDGVDGGTRRVSSDIGSFGVPRESTAPLRTPTPRQSRPLNQLSISVMENGQGVGESFEKEKRTPKANQFYRNSDFLLAKDKFPPAESNKKSKLNGKRHAGELGIGFGPNSKAFKSCNTLLERLMKHKHGWVFNTPVDVETLRLHDYYTIIKHPMDLGTVKSRLGKNGYKTPEEFAEDVRLTFYNAMTYNPKGQDVHVMAEQLLKIFEDKWATIKSDYDREMRFTTTYHMGVRTPPPRKAPLLPVAPLDMSRILERSESMTYSAFEPRQKPMSTTPTFRTPAPKKPKAKDPNKRDMTYEEKQKLSTNLQSLPSEKLDNIVQIIKKRSSSLSQHDDEIEVDIDSVDAETLWELDRFVINYKKSLSKNKRKAELVKQARAEAQQRAQEKTPAPLVAEAPKDSNTNRDESNIPTSPPPQAKKQGDNGSRSSSSSSSGSDSESSSNDSDSDSSSSSGSDD